MRRLNFEQHSEHSRNNDGVAGWPMILGAALVLGIVLSGYLSDRLGVDVASIFGEFAWLPGK